MRRIRKLLATPFNWGYRLSYRIGVYLFVAACWVEGEKEQPPQAYYCECEDGPLPIYFGIDDKEYCERCGREAYPF